MLQSKRRMAAQRERELRNYHVEHGIQTGFVRADLNAGACDCAPPTDPRFDALRGAIQDDAR